MVEFQPVEPGFIAWRNVLAQLDTPSFLVTAQTTTWPGRLAFAGVFALLIVWLLFVPGSRLVESIDDEVLFSYLKTAGGRGSCRAR